MPSYNGRKIVRRTLADGTVKEYTYTRRGPRYGVDSIGALLAAYKASPEWAALAERSKINYGYYIRDIETLAEMQATTARRRDFIAVRNAIATSRGNSAANTFMRVSATIFGWARDADILEHSPIERVKALPGGHLAAWTPEEADIAAERLPDPLRRVVILARYTGQRRGDLIAMTWNRYDGQTITVAQEKGRLRHPKPPLVIPVHPALRTALDGWRKQSTHILTSHTGRPWQPNNLTLMMGRELPKIGLRGELNVHGLRKLAASELAAAGCSTHEIAAITGHRTLAMVQLYTASADQQRLAQAAIYQLENAPGKRRKTPS